METTSNIQVENKLLHVAASPHVTTSETMQRMMFDVLIALIPSVVVAGVVFGLQAIVLIAACVVSAVAAEAIFQTIRKQPVTIKDGSAMITGVLLAFNLPSTYPIWKAALGAVFAIVIAKQFFGGLGSNFVNPALAGRAFLMSAWAKDFANTPFPFGVKPAGTDAVTAATPLSGGPTPGLWDMFVGNMPGMLGEVSALAILIGAAYLLWRGVIRIRIPAGMIGSFVVFTSLFGMVTGQFQPAQLPTEVLSGGLVLGAFFMATDYATTPMTARGQLIFAIGAGFITALIRHFGTLPEGVSYAILLMNVATPLIDKYVKNKPFGGVSK